MLSFIAAVGMDDEYDDEETRTMIGKVKLRPMRKEENQDSSAAVVFLLPTTTAARTGTERLMMDEGAVIKDFINDSRNGFAVDSSFTLSM
jgi:hypothetical protein